VQRLNLSLTGFGALTLRPLIFVPSALILNMSQLLAARPSAGSSAVNRAQVSELIAKACPARDYRNKRVLLIVPDGTRTAPVGLLFQTLHDQIGGVTKLWTCSLPWALTNL